MTVMTLKTLKIKMENSLFFLMKLIISEKDSLFYFFQ